MLQLLLLRFFDSLAKAWTNEGSAEQKDHSNHAYKQWPPYVFPIYDVVDESCERNEWETKSPHQTFFEGADNQMPLEIQPMTPAITNTMASMSMLRSSVSLDLAQQYLCTQLSQRESG